MSLAPRNGGSASQPRIPAVVPDVDLEEQVAALVGTLGTAVVKLEYLSHCFDRLGDTVVEMRRDILSLKQAVHVIEDRTAHIPAIKTMLAEVLVEVSR